MVSSPYIIKLLDMVIKEGGIMLIYEYMESDLHWMMEESGCVLSEAEIKTIMIMLLKGVEECHKHNIVHRDLKPSNLLISEHNIIKIADFGLARVIVGKEEGCSDEEEKCPLSLEIATRWYKAPELLLGSKNYGKGIDLWAIGCIFAQMITQTPLFPGTNDLDQLFKIIKVLGTPSPISWPHFQNLPDYSKLNFPIYDPVHFGLILPNASTQAVNLLQAFLTYDPQKRIPVKHALKHDYFFTKPLPVSPNKINFVFPTRNSSIFGKDETKSFQKVPKLFHFSEF
jgi:cell cycle related kinase